MAENNRESTGGGMRRCPGARVKAALLLAVCSLVSLSLAPTAGAVTRAKIGEFGIPAGSGKGQLEQPDGIAVNRTGAGGVSPGDVYVVDGGEINAGPTENNRIEEFSLAGAFVRAWGIDVVASGPDDKGSGAFEVCLPVDVCKAGTLSQAAGGMSRPEGIAIDQSTGTVYVIDANQNSLLNNARVNVYSAKGAFEGSFGWDVDATSPEEKLQFCTSATGCQKGSRGGGAGQFSPASPRSLPAVDPSNGDLYVPEGGLSGKGNFRIEEFAPTLNGAEEVAGVSFVKAVGWDVVASGPDQADETQLVKVRAGAGKFKLKYKTESTGELEYNAPPASVEAALNALPALSGEGFTVTVSGGPGTPTASASYEVVFHSTPKGEGAEPLAGVSVSLSAGSGETSIKTETYNQGGVGLESCVAAHPLDVCKAGVEGPINTDSEKPKLGQFSEANPSSVAVDGSGTLYAVNKANLLLQGPNRVFKFTFPAPGEVVASEFAPEHLTETSVNPDAVSLTDVAVDRDDDHVVVAKKEGLHYKFLEFDSAGHLLGESPPAGLAAAAGGGLAVGNEERFYFSDNEKGVDILGPPPPPAVCCVAVSEVGARTATLTGAVTPVVLESEHFATSYHFEYSKNGISWTSFPAVNVEIGDGSAPGSSETCPTPQAAVCEVRQEAFGLEPGTDYLVRLVASNGAVATSSAVAFATSVAPPGVGEEAALEVEKTCAKLSGLVNPNNRPSTYHFEWGTTTAYGNDVPAFEAFAGSGGEATKVVAPLCGLKEGTAYHFRIVATNSSGETKGPDQEFSTLDSFGLPNARAPEQVSPSDKRPVGQVSQLLRGQIRYQAAADGNSIVYPLLNGLAGATAGGNVEYLSSRTEAGWEPTQLTPPSLVPPIVAGVGNDTTGLVMYAAADLSCQLIESPEPLGETTPELEEEVAKGMESLFRRKTDGTYIQLNPKPIDFEAPNFNSLSNYHVDWASSDCDHILFDTGYRLLPGAPVGTRGLYEWAEGTLRLAGILPDGSVSGNAAAGLGEVLTTPGDGANFTNVNSMSADGSRVFFTAISDAGKDSGKEAVFVRSGGVETVDASQGEGGSTDQGARYAMATPSGSKVFFVANYGLAMSGTSSGAASCASATSSGGGDGTGCDLYEYDTESGALIDLSADTNPADTKGASVVGLLDASADGSDVYFAARGQLLKNRGRTEAQNLQGNGTYNVYLRRGGGQLSYVGPIASADASINVRSGSDLTFSFGHWVADATADGEHLLFVSKADVSGYDSGGVAEVYLYSAAEGTTVCLSCRSDGGKAEGNGETAPLTEMTQPGFQMTTDVQNRPRSISEDGHHVFFTSLDPLVAGAKAGTHNIYEWSGGQLYLLAAGEEGIKDFTEYKDSSPSGDDAFLVTKAKLVPQDFDNTIDLYDLRVPHVAGEKVGPEAVAPQPPPCEALSGKCQGPPTPPPAETPPPASEGFSGAGNPAPEEPKKPPHHRGKKHKKHRHGKRRAGR